MTTDYKYDVFISYSRKDYVDENKNILPNNAISAVKDAFDKNGITYWFDEEGIYSGQAFVDIITEAIALSKAFVFISSKNSNHSKWTKSEILEAFDSDKTIIPFKIDDTEYDKSLKFFLRPLDFIPYFENKDNAIQELIRSVQKVKDEIAEEEKKRQDETKRLKIKDRIKELVEDYQRLSTQQETIQSELFEQSKLLGLDVKKCPVCGKSSKIDDLYCDRCGWTFHPLFALDENISFPNHKILFSIFKTQWKSLGRIAEDRKNIDGLSSENKLLKEQLKEIEEVKKKLTELTEENKVLKETRDKISLEREKLNQTIKEKESEALFYRNEVATVRKEFDALNTENKQLKKTIDKITKECERYTKALKEKESEAKALLTKHSELAKSECYYKEIADLIDTQKKDLEQQITTLKKELLEQTLLYKRSEEKLKQIESDYQKSKVKTKELENKLSSANTASTQQYYRRITRQKVTQLILDSRTNSCQALFPQDKTAATIRFDQLRDGLKTYGIDLSFVDFCAHKTIEELKEAIFKKAGI